MAREAPDPPRIRPMRPEDAAEVALLSGQLGYPATAEAIARRFRDFAGREDRIALVALDADGALLGWIQGHVEGLLESDPTAGVGRLDP